MLVLAPQTPARAAGAGQAREKTKMKKITDSLQMTVIAGLVLTVIVLFVAPIIAGDGGGAQGAVKEMTDKVKGE